MSVSIALALFGVLSAASATLFVLLRSDRRCSEDVLNDLRGAGTTAEGSSIVANVAANKRTSVLRDLYGARGLFSSEDRAAFRRRRVFRGILIALFPPAIIAAAGGAPFAAPFLALVPGIGLAYLVDQHSMRSSQQHFIRQLEFFLPIIMERIVMAVQAGLDVLPAINRLLEIDSAQGPISNSKETSESPAADPVSKLLRMVLGLTEAGLSFEDSLREIAGSVESSALKHAFIHLAVAQQEGGELVMPLRELSDSTQLYFQESVEEEIATMPIRATLPLLCTFAGLILFFITSPLIQVLTMMAQAMPKGGG